MDSARQEEKTVTGVRSLAKRTLGLESRRTSAG